MHRLRLASLRRVALTGICTLGAGLLASVPAYGATGYGLVKSFGSGTLAFPMAVAVDQSTNDVYVADFVNNTIDNFDSQGNLLQPPFGNASFAGVAVDPAPNPNDNNATGDVYAYDAANEKIQTLDPSSATPGTAVTTPFSVPGGGFVFVQIASDSSGDVYYPDQVDSEVQKYDANGNVLQTFGAGTLSSSIRGVAVDSAGNVYVSDPGNQAVYKFNSSGTLQTLRFDQGGSPQSVTVDSSGDVFVLDLASGGYHVIEYDSSGNQLTDFGLGQIGGSSPPPADTIAVDDSTGDVYVTDLGTDTVDLFAPITLPTVTTGTPATGVTTTTAMVPGTVNPNGVDTSYFFQYGLNSSYTGAGSGEMPPSPGTDIGSGTTDVPVTADLTGLQPNATYHYQLVATNTEGGRATGGDQTFTTRPAKPSVDGESTTGTTQTDATLQAQVNPNNEDTTYFFKYGTDTSHTLGQVPLSPTDIGSGYGDQLASADIGGGLLPNTVYHFQVVATNATGTTYGSDQTFTTLPANPAMTGVSASEVGPSSATLGATLNPEGVETTYQFNYGTTTGYGSSTTAVRAGPDTNGVPVSADISGLSPNTVYHFDLVATATNVTGPTTTTSPDQTFTTPPPAPYIDVPTALTSSSVTLNGSVYPDRVATSYHFDYGPTAGYGNTAPSPDGSAGSGTGSVPVSLNLSGLSPGTYHYRLVATTADGTTSSPDETFSLYGPAPPETGNPFATGPPPPAILTAPILTAPTPVISVPKLVSLAILSRQIIEGNRVLLVIRTSASGDLTLSGKYLKTVRKAALKAGTHRISADLTKAGQERRKEHRKTNLHIQVKFASASSTMSRITSLGIG
jgi:hypothetical protein